MSPKLETSPSLRLPNFLSLGTQPGPPPELDWAPDRHLWNYGLAGGGAPITQLMSLLRNGGISNADLPEERRWSFEGRNLRLHRQDGSVSATFGPPRRQDGRLILSGLRQEAQGVIRPVELVSRLIYGAISPGERVLCVENSIRYQARTLLVVFNSGGYVFDGKRPPQYDFYNISETLQTDVLRFAEHEGAFARYLDKTRLVLEHIETVLRFGYRKVIMLGLSAAGYISIHMASVLAQRHPELSVGSVVANAQLMLDDEAETELMQQVDGDMLSPIWTGSLDHVDFEACNMDMLLRRHGNTGARHVVIYDSGNAGEVYHSERLAGLPGVEMAGEPLGMSHATGLFELCRREKVLVALQSMMRN